jgi:hypothetical protein
MAPAVPVEATDEIVLSTHLDRTGPVGVPGRLELRAAEGLIIRRTAAG